MNGPRYFRMTTTATKVFISCSYSRSAELKRIMTAQQGSMEQQLIPLLQEDSPSWSVILALIVQQKQLDEANVSPTRTALPVDRVSGLTALHLAVSIMNQDDDANCDYDCWTEVVQALLERYPEATTVRCLHNGYTPLAHAVMAAAAAAAAAEKGNVAAAQKDIIIRHCAERIQSLLVANPASVRLTTVPPQIPGEAARDSKMCPLALYIRSVSRNLRPCRRDTPTTRAMTDSTCEAAVSTVVLQAIMAPCTLEQLYSALETLYGCNTFSVLQHCTPFMSNTALSSSNIERNNISDIYESYNSQKAANNSSNSSSPQQSLDTFWVWQWVLCILQCVHEKRCQPESSRIQYQKVKNKRREESTESVQNAAMPQRVASQNAPLVSSPLFCALHTAAQITDCPPPFVYFAMHCFPDQLRLVNELDCGNLPLHAVACWTPNQQSSSFLSSTCRKSMILTSLVAANPSAVRTKNRQGKTPVDLETSSGAVIV